MHSIETLQNQVATPLLECFGPTTRVLTVEDHNNEVRGLALCPGKIVKYIYQIQSKQLRTIDLLAIKKRIPSMLNSQ